MKVPSVSGFEARDIQDQVSKILRGLGNPEPPLNLADVRHLQRLDRQYYSSNDTSAIREIISRVKVAGLQVLERPMLLFEAIRKADLSALYLPDARRILIDQDKPVLKHRWSEAHEIGHSIIPWHVEMNLGDTDFTLRPECHTTIEAEANFAAGQLLFMQGRFVRDARSVRHTIQAIRSLATRYGNTVTSTLWRFIESVPHDVAVMAVVCQHPKRVDASFDPLNPCKYMIPSARFRREFSRVTEQSVFNLIQGYCENRSGGPLGEAEVLLQDDNGSKHVFRFESFYNRYEALTIGSCLSQAPVAVAF